MRNLKRALSLALAMVMVLSMMVIGAGAASYDDFSDKDEIVNTEAVSVLVELGVINGKDDGSFDPTGIVTRAEMAKMICVVLNGGKGPSLGSTVNSTYTDTVGHWASGYIEYCTQLGIVAGKGDGTFDPNGTVTGSEAAKMLLVALGYKSEIEGFTGSNWAVGVNVRANQKGLYDDLDISVDAGLSRDNAAQMIYNALDANMVEYTYSLYADEDSSLTSSPTLQDKVNNDGYEVTLLEDRFNAVKVEGIVVANEYANLSGSNHLNDERTRILVTNYDDQAYYGASEDDNGYTEGLDGFNTTKPEENNGYYAILQVRVPTDLENVTHYQTWKADWGTAGEWSTNAELDGTNYFILVLRLDDGGSTPSDLQVQWTDADGDVIGTSTVKFDISGLTFG